MGESLSFLDRTIRDSLPSISTDAQPVINLKTGTKQQQEAVTAITAAADVSGVSVAQADLNFAKVNEVIFYFFILDRSCS
jgi:hypothetical protein